MNIDEIELNLMQLHPKALLQWLNQQEVSQHAPLPFQNIEKKIQIEALELNKSVGISTLEKVKLELFLIESEIADLRLGIELLGDLESQLDSVFASAEDDEQWNHANLEECRTRSQKLSLQLQKLTQELGRLQEVFEVHSVAIENISAAGEIKFFETQVYKNQGQYEEFLYFPPNSILNQGFELLKKVTEINKELKVNCDALKKEHASARLNLHQIAKAPKHKQNITDSIVRLEQFVSQKIQEITGSDFDSH